MLKVKGFGGVVGRENGRVEFGVAVYKITNRVEAEKFDFLVCNAVAAKLLEVWV